MTPFETSTLQLLRTIAGTLEELRLLAGGAPKVQKVQTPEEIAAWGRVMRGGLRMIGGRRPEDAAPGEPPEFADNLPPAGGTPGTKPPARPSLKERRSGE
jgi:hypothetical protein